MNYTYPDVDPGHAAIKNKLGIKDRDELEGRTEALVSMRAAEIEAGKGPGGNFDAEHLKAIHRHLFQDVYEWAGRTRDEPVSLSDGTVATEPVIRKVDGKAFLIGTLIPGALDEIASKLRNSDYLRDLPREEFAERGADFMAEINSIHPFREGNGRTQRVFMEELAKDAGHMLDFSVISSERMTRASIAAHEQDDPSMMRRLFEDASDPTRLAALHHAIETFTNPALPADRQFPWHDHYLATVEPGHEVKITMVGVAGDYFMARTRSEILIGQAVDLPAPPPARHETFLFEARSSWASTDRELSVQAPATRRDGDDAPGVATGTLVAAETASRGAARLVGRVFDGLADAAEKVIGFLDGLFGGGSPSSPPEQEPPRSPDAGAEPSRDERHEAVARAAETALQVRRADPNPTVENEADLTAENNPSRYHERGRERDREG